MTGDDNVVNLGRRRILRDLERAREKLTRPEALEYRPSEVLLHPRDHADRAAVHGAWCASWCWPGPLAVADACCSCGASPPAP